MRLFNTDKHGDLLGVLWRSRMLRLLRVLVQSTVCVGGSISSDHLYLDPLAIFLPVSSLFLDAQLDRRLI